MTGLVHSLHFPKDSGFFKIAAEYVANLGAEGKEKLLTSKAKWQVGLQTKSIYGHCALHAAACNLRDDKICADIFYRIDGAIALAPTVSQLVALLKEQG